MFDVAHLTIEDFKQLVLAARLTSIMNPAVGFEHNLDILWRELQKYYATICDTLLYFAETDE